MRSWLGPVMLAVGGLMSACAPETPPARSVPAYTASGAALFGDEIESSALDRVEAAREAMADDEHIHRRIEAADGVAAVTVITLTSGTRDRGSAPSYRVAVRVERVLRGEAPPDPLVLDVPAGSPGHAQVRRHETELVGRRLLLIYKRFAEGGRVRLHWHAAPPLPELVEGGARGGADDPPDGEAPAADR